jgi:putative CocE/NonD family hydrolase
MFRSSSQRVRALLISVSLTLLTAGITVTTTAAQDPATSISELGQYSGYSTPQYSGSVRTSQYVAVRDGTRLAVDVYRPIVDDAAVEGPLPVLLTFERYHRARMSPDGSIQTQEQLWPFVTTWLSHGYVVVAADVRGSGASFGTRPGEFLDTDSTDASDLIDWITDQPWSDGNVGMYGLSYPGMTQWMAAGAAPEGLKAIVPAMTMFDLFSFSYPGGVFLDDAMDIWANSTNEFLDKQLPPVPVDEDTDGSLARAAQAEHQANLNVHQQSSRQPYRDSVDDQTGEQTYLTRSLYRFLPGINESGVAVYGIAGWFDAWPRDHAVWFENLTVPKRLLFTPFDHVAGTDPGWQAMSGALLDGDFQIGQIVAFLDAEYMRFFDYHLKGIDNGIMDEPPIWYYTLGAPADHAWSSSEGWPLADQVPTRYYFGAGPSGSIASLNDGSLDTTTPTADVGQDEFTVDHAMTMGPKTRWQRVVGGEFEYGDMAGRDLASLTYTTPPLPEALEVTGHPIVHLWVSSDAEDADLFAYLEKVGADGYVHYLTEGVLRASHRALAEPPYRYLGLPYHRSFAGDAEPLPAETPVELVFDLHPTSVLFQSGERLRVRVVGADADTFLTPELDPAPTVSVHRDGAHASYIELPVIPGDNE